MPETTPPAKVALDDLTGHTKTVTMEYADLLALYNAGAASPEPRVQEAAARLVALLDDYRPPSAEQPGDPTTPTEPVFPGIGSDAWRAAWIKEVIADDETPDAIGEELEWLLGRYEAAVKRAEEAEAALAGLPEWHCPNCHAVTRARMADHQHPPEYEYSVDYGGITWPAPTREAAIRIAAGSTSGEARVIRRALGEWEADPTAATAQDGDRNA